jgi:hypothetical protein
VSLGPRPGTDLEPFFQLGASGPMKEIFDIFSSGNAASIFSEIRIFMRSDSVPCGVNSPLNRFA